MTYRITVTEDHLWDCEETLGPDWQRVYTTRADALEAAEDAALEYEFATGDAIEIGVVAA